MELGEHDQAKQLLCQLALGETEAGGRELSSRITAARSRERLTTEEPEPPAAIQERHYPVCSQGIVCPTPGPQWWHLWSGCDWGARPLAVDARACRAGAPQLAFV